MVPPSNKTGDLVESAATATVSRPIVALHKSGASNSQTGRTELGRITSAAFVADLT